MAVELSVANLHLIDKASRPSYDRSALRPGILHIGVGNFHRAHQAVYLDRLFDLGLDHDWAICGAGLMPFDAEVRAALEKQDYLSTVVEQDIDKSFARVTGPMVEFVPTGDPLAIVERLADPAIRIVSMTVTEGGYFLDSDGRFDIGQPQIVSDGESPDHPQTVFGVIVKALKARRESDQVPPTILSCDNLPHNGDITRNAVTQLAALSDPSLAEWIGRNVTFPNSMVDRITPATGERERRMLQSDFDIQDQWPVFCEGFSQWVLEDRFVAGRPALQNVGVQFVDDVSPYETMKIRILNGGHAIIAYPAGLLDIEFVHEAMQHDLIRAFLTRIENEEIIPVVPPVPDTNLKDYLRTIETRFANPKIGDTVRRLCLDGSNRQPKFIVPSIADNLAAGRRPDGLALESALWCRYCYGETESGAVIKPNDPNWDRLQELAKAARNEPEKWLELKSVYGPMARDTMFRNLFTGWLKMLWQQGTIKTLEAYLGHR